MEWLVTFVEQNLLKQQLLCVLQVGSSARGYALDNSDVDLMAFYRISGDFRAFPNHSTFGDTRVTLEHHDLTTFLIENGDFRFNPGSLRQMHKVRDGRVVLGKPENIAVLREVAAAASLDPRIPLRYLASIQDKLTSLRNAAEVVQHQTLIGWTEMAATFLVTSTVGVPAYSKPKWLLKTLDGAAFKEAAALVRSLYAPTASLRQASLDALLAMYAAENARIPESHRILVRTAMNDAAQMVKHAPDDAGPAVRFAAIQLWRSLYARSPVVDIRADRPVPEFLIHALGTADTSLLGDWWLSFERFVDGTWTRVVSSSQQKLESTIGTNRFVTHLLDTYEATDMLPYLSAIAVTGWIGAKNEVLTP